MSKENEIVVFADNIGRTIIGRLDNESKTTLSVKNPAVLNIQPNQQTGQIQVQLIPYFFKEFVVGGVDKDVVWDFLKPNIVRARNVNLDERLVSQYKNMYSVIKAPDSGSGIVTPGQAGPTSDAPVVKLFDD